MKQNIHIGGVTLVLIGLIFFIDNFIPINLNWDYIWPIILIVIGVSLILSKNNKSQ